MVPGWIPFHYSTMGTPGLWLLTGGGTQLSETVGPGQGIET